MSTTTDITTLKINYLTQAQYNAALAQGLINENELYLTPSESKPAASGGIDLSLVTTGEKYTWNQKQDALVSGTNIKTINNTSILGAGDISVGTVTSIATGAGLTGGPVTSSGTIKANLVSETSQGTIGITNKLYAVGVDSAGALCASVPWTDTTYTAGTGISIDSNNVISVNLPNAEGGEF